MTTPSSGSTIPLGDRTAPNNVGEAATLGTLNGTNPSGISPAAAQSHDASDMSRRNDPPAEDLRSEENGYERKIGRGTSWRRDHDNLGEDQYTSRGRGRGRGRPYRGRGNYPPYYESRDYPDRRYYDRPAHGQPADPRGPPYAPDDPYYESRGHYPPPGYDRRRNYPPDPSARYHEDYRRGYDSREFVPPPPTSMRPPMDSRRPYDRGPTPGRAADSSDYDRPYPRPRDPRDDFRGDPRGPRDESLRFPPDTRPPRDSRADLRFIDEGRIPPPIEGRPREPLDSRRPLSGRDYPRIPSREVDLPPSLVPAALSNMQEDSLVPARESPRKNIDDLGRDPPGQGGRPAMDSRPIEPSYGYDRERPSPLERYRDARDYGRDSYGAYEGRGRGFPPRDVRDPPYSRPRDSRAPYEDFPPLPSEGRPREPYPSRGPPPLDYSRITAHEDRYSRGPPVDLEPPRAREGGYRDLPARSFDSGQKRRYDGDYVDRYGEDLGARDAGNPDRYGDYPRPPFDVDERDPKRARALDGGRLPPDPRDPAFRRPHPPDDRFGPRHDEDIPYPIRSDYIPRHERSRPNGRYFLAKTSTAENIAKSRETNRWGIAVKDVEIFREAFKSGPVSLLFALDESGRFCGYATMTSDVGAVPPMPWMEEHCSPIGAAFEVKHMTTDDVRTTLTTKLRNHLCDGQPIRFGPDGQEISGNEAAGLVDELERMSGPENAERRASAVVVRGGGPRGRGRGGDRGGRGSSGRGYYEGYRGRGRGRD